MCIQMDVDVCSHSVPAFTVVWISLCDNSTWYHKVLMCVVYCLGSWNCSSDLWDVCVCVCVRAYVRVRVCACACVHVRA